MLTLTKVLPALISSGSFTGSFYGTSSYAKKALTASYAMNGGGGGSGTSGTSGATGTSGTSGNSGSSGTSGNSGTNGTSGNSGSSGTSGGGASLTTGSLYPITSSWSRKSITASYLTTISQSLIPAKNNTYSLGTTTVRWKDLFVSTGSIYIGDVKLSTSGSIVLANSLPVVVVNTSSKQLEVPGLPIQLTSSYANKALTASYVTGVGVGSSGTSGNNGTSGTSGTSSTAGSSGTSGQNGTSATAGSSGSSGNSGSSGTSGSSGSSGTSGTTGSSGSSGSSGNNGTSGSSGATGASGSSGTSGGGVSLTTGSLYPITSSWSRRSLTASYALNASGGGSTLRTGSRYPITASRAITASYALNGGTALVNQTMNYVSGSNLYILSRSVVSPSDVLLSVNGIIQTPITDYTVSASRVTFTESYPSGSKINARYLVTATNSSDVNLANIVLTGTTTGDAYYPQVAALLHFDGTNGSTTITDNSKNNLAVTSVNGTAISTAQSKFGGASVFFDGTNDYVTVPDNSEFDFGAGDFTIEYWEYRTNTTNQSPILSRNTITFTPYLLGWYDLPNAGTTAIGLYMSSNGSSWDVASHISMGTITTNVWTHYAVTRNGNTFRTFQNGTQISTFTSTATFPAGSGTLQIGRLQTTFYFKGGYIDELRITKGYARYTGNFTPSTTAFSNTGGDVGKALVVNSTATGVSIGTAGFNLNSSNINRIINGAMTIDQRNAGAAQTITAAAALAYTADRWYAYCTGANVTGQRITGSANNQYAYRFTGAASVTGIGFGQRIEAANSFDLAGSTVTLGVDLANSVLTSVTWTVYYANTSDTFGTLASPTRTQISTGTFTVNSTLSRYSTQIFIPSAATTGIEIVFSVGAQTSGTWTIDNVQLEAGPLATPFERRNIAQELVNCQRYYESGGGVNTNSVYAVVYYKATKRTTASVTLSNYGGSITSAPEPAGGSTANDNFAVLINTTTGFRWTASAEL